MLVPINQKDMIEEAMFLLAKYGVRGRNAAMEARRHAQESLAKTAFSDYMNKKSQLVAQGERYWIESLPKLTQSEADFIIMDDGFTLWPMDENLFLRLVAAKFIEHDEPMPDILRRWLIAELKTAHAQQRNAPSPCERANVFRDAAILGAVKTISAKYEIAPTRNRNSNAAPTSACQIVAEALGQLRVNVSELAVEKIWNNRPFPKMEPFFTLDGIDIGKVSTWGRNPRHTKRR